MAMSKIPILAPVATGYRDAWHAIRAMPVLTAYACLIMLAGNALEYLLPVRAEQSVFFGALIAFLVSAVQNFSLTPIMIAVHRFIVLEQITPTYVLDPQHRSFRAFFGWLMALTLLALVWAFITPNSEEAPTVSLAILLISMVVVIVVCVRLAILFPAIATDAPGATAANAWHDSKKNTFRIFMIFVLSVLPLFIAVLIFLVPAALTDNAQTEGPLGIPAMIGVSLVQAAFLIFCVVIASRIYEALADRLLRV